MTFDRGPLNYDVELQISGISDDQWRTKTTSAHGILDPAMRKICLQLNEDQKRAGLLAPKVGPVPDHLVIRDISGRLT